MNKYQQIYMKRAKLIAYFLQIIPFIRTIFLTGSVARIEATEKSDIDFLIITQKNRIWTCRALVTLLIQFLGLRRTNKKIAGRICLNRYQTQGHLLINPHNQYTAKDTVSALLLSGDSKILENWHNQNQWVIKHGFRFNQGKIISIGYKIISFPLILIRFIQEIMWEVIFNDWAENKLSQYQIKRILSDNRTQNSSKKEIYISNKEIRFHPRENIYPERSRMG